MGYLEKELELIDARCPFSVLSVQMGIHVNGFPTLEMEI